MLVSYPNERLYDNRIMSLGSLAILFWRPAGVASVIVLDRLHHGCIPSEGKHPANRALQSRWAHKLAFFLPLN